MVALTDFSPEPSLQFQKKISVPFPSPLRGFLTIWHCSCRSLGPLWPYPPSRYLLKYHQAFGIYGKCYFIQDALTRAIPLSDTTLLFCLVVQSYVDPCLLLSTASSLRPTTIFCVAFTLKHLPHIINGQYKSAKLKWFQKVSHRIKKSLSIWWRKQRMAAEFQNLGVKSELCHRQDE